VYTGDGSGFSVNNGIDLSTKGGLVWLKDRSAANFHSLYDTARGATNFLRSNGTDVQGQNGNSLTAFNSNGFTIGDAAFVNTASNRYVSWTFRKQPKFFDIVTYTGNGVTNRQIPHNLQSTPGCVMIKKTSLNTGSNGDWIVWNRGVSSPSGSFGLLNGTNAFGVNSDALYFTNPTSTHITVGTADTVNTNGESYIAYIFAHNAGGFGLTDTDNVISCGSFTSTGATRLDINLGYEPQWVLIKRSNSTSQWYVVDNMRGLPAVNGESSNDPTSRVLFPNLSNAEGDYSVQLRANGFSMPAGQFAGADETYIYIAIRRPMKTPTSGTSVYNAIARTGTSTAVTLTGVGFTPDLLFDDNRTSTTPEPFKYWWDRLRGTRFLTSTTTNAEAGGADDMAGFDTMDGVRFGSSASERTNASGKTYINWFFRRAPGFFDIVAYTGTGSARTIAHNLGVAPEMMIIKRRDSSASWPVYHSAYGPTETAFLNSNGNADPATPNKWNSTAPTSSVFSLDNANDVNINAGSFIAYLFASCPGVSKVGSYVGSGTTKQIDCGFTTGARFVMIKRYDDVDPGAWYVWDSTRGIVAGNDPYLIINSTAAEVTNTDYIDAFNSGFEISSTAPAAINGSGGLFLFLAIS
jgi:hypothetical protein